jgi:L-proline cis-4-hydroxylase
VETRLLGSIDLDHARLAEDLKAVEALPFNSSYKEFACGDLSSSMLFNRTGDISDIMLGDYTGPGQMTAAGKSMPYVTGVVGKEFDLATLQFARLLRLGPNSVIVPHRDYLELGKRFTRIHVPLRTDEHCFSSEGDKIYQMRMGETWHLDASRLHSAASFSPVRRVHMILDFEEASDPRSLLRVPDGVLSNEAAIPASHTVHREPIGAAEKRALDGLSGVLAEDNLTDVLSMLVKVCYQRDVPMGSVFAWLQEIAAAGGRPDVVARVFELEKYFAKKR